MKDSLRRAVRGDRERGADAPHLRIAQPLDARDQRADLTVEIVSRLTTEGRRIRIRPGSTISRLRVEGDGLRAATVAVR